jgi:hypothetical protein
MSQNDSTSMIPAQRSKELETSISSFNPAMASFLQDLGLPTENILSPIDERRRVVNALEDALSILPLEEREKAYYITKFTVAVAVGLFDGALNYLWNETVNALRRLVSRFDLGYFFSVAGTINPRNRNISSAEDLDQIEDHDLLEACRRIGLISDINHRRLEHVNYMRNHASAAHPNENDVSGYEILNWLTTCLKYAIKAEPDHSVISMKMLLANIRTESIPMGDFPHIGSEIVKVSQERIDDLLWTLFGMYVDPKMISTAKTNIANLAPYVWPASSEDRKYEIGARFGVFRKNAEIARKDAAQEFLQIVNGQKYKDEDSLAGELIEKLNTLKSVHFGINNFYNEYAHAKSLEQSLPLNGVVPRAARLLWVKVISICCIGNGYGYKEGVDESALPYYKKYIQIFSEDEVSDFLRLFEDPEFTTSLDRSKPDRRARKLAEYLKSKTENIHMQRALNLIINAPERTLYGIANTNAFKNALKYVR